MIFLFGERIKTHPREQGSFDCPICARTCDFTRFEETNYFTVFGIALLPLFRIADYCQCSLCGNSYEPGSYSEPALYKSLRRVLVYIMMGYSMERHSDTLKDVYAELTDVACDDHLFRDEQTAVTRDKRTLIEYLKEQSQYLNIQAKQKVIEAAYLMTYVCCELQHEDRVRINLIGDALGISLEFVEAIIHGVRSQGYYGIRRLLPVY